MDAKQGLLSTDAIVKYHCSILKGVVCKKDSGFRQLLLPPALFRDSGVRASGDMNEIGAFPCSLWVCKRLSKFKTLLLYRSDVLHMSVHISL